MQAIESGTTTNTYRKNSNMRLVLADLQSCLGTRNPGNGRRRSCQWGSVDF